jgi:hypothetical protein
VREIKALKDRGYSHADIARKTDLDVSYVRGILQVLDCGEERLLLAVEKGQLPVSIRPARQGPPPGPPPDREPPGAGEEAARRAAPAPRPAGLDRDAAQDVPAGDDPTEDVRRRQEHRANAAALPRAA